MSDIKVWENPNLLNTERLRNELERFGIKVPASYTTKKQLVALYESSLSHLKDNPTELQRMANKAAPAAVSSPSNVTAGSTPSRPAGKKSLAKSDPVPDFVKKLSDEELFAALTKIGAKVGPVSAATRSVYEKQYVRLLEQREDLQVAGKTTSANSATRKTPTSKTSKAKAKPVVVSDEGEEDEDEEEEEEANDSDESEDLEVSINVNKRNAAKAAAAAVADGAKRQISSVKNTEAYRVAEAAAQGQSYSTSSASSYSTSSTASYAANSGNTVTHRSTKAVRPEVSSSLFSDDEPEKPAVVAKKPKAAVVHTDDEVSSIGRSLCYILLIMLAAIVIYTFTLSTEKRAELVHQSKSTLQSLSHSTGEFFGSFPDRLRAYLARLKGKEVQEVHATQQIV